MKNIPKTSIYPGLLKIEIVEANLARDVETFSKMDPYCQADWTDQFSNEKNLSKPNKLMRLAKFLIGV